MSAPSRRCPDHPASPPDSSASRRPASSDLDSSAAPRGAARGRALAPALRRAAGALLALALTLGLAAPAGAQTIDETHIVEGETKTFTVTGIPASWGNAKPGFDSRSTGSTTSHHNAVTCNGTGNPHWANWDICYNNATSALTWDSSTRTFTFELQARADSVSDPGETAVYRLRDSTDTYTQLFTITIDEPVTVALSASSYTVSEGDALTVGVTLSAARSADTAVVVWTSDGTANGQGVDYDSSIFTITVPAGRTTATGTVRTIEDNLWEGDEHFSVFIVSGQLPTGVTAGSPSQVPVTIEDDEPDPVLSVRLSPASGAEGDSGDTYANVAVTLSPAHAKANTDFLLCIKNTGTATFRTAQGNDVADFDLVDRGTNTGRTVDASNCLATQVPVTHGSLELNRLRIIGDTDIESDETAVVELRRVPGTPSDVTISATAGTATYTIRDDDAQPKVFFQNCSSSISFSESVGTHWCHVTFLRPSATGALTEPLTVSYTLGGTATAGTDYTIAGADYQAGTGTFTLPSGTRAGRGGAAIAIAVLDDAVIEGDETIVLTLVDGTDYVLGTASTTTTITVTDNDDKPTLSLAPSTTTTVAEGDAATVGVVLSEARSAATAVAVRMTALSATGGGVDFDSSALTLTVPAGETTATGTVRTTEDTACEADETFRVAIDASRAPAGVRLASPRQAVIAIEDDDTCTLGFESASHSVTEGGAVSVTVTIDPARSVPTQVGLVYRDANRADPVYRDGGVDHNPYRDWRRGVDTAHRQHTSYSRQHRIAIGKDYEASPERITIPADATSHTFTVRTVGDPPDARAQGWAESIWLEPDETFTIGIGSFPDRYSRGASPTTTVTIEDDDAATTVTLARAGPARVDEGTAARFALTATPAPAAPLSVTVEVADSGNFAASGQSGVRQVTVGTDGTGVLTVATTDDQTAEDHGTLTAQLRSGGGYRRGASREASVRVSDDDITGRFVHLHTIAALPEGAYTDFNHVLSKRLDGDQTLTLPLTVGGTATRGTDYRLVCVESGPAGAGTCNGFDGASPSVTFHGAHMNGYRVTGPLRLEAIEDHTAESDETVDLSFGGGRVLTTTLRDAPTSVVLSFARGAFLAEENNSPFHPILRTTPTPGRAIEVPLVFTDITATAGADYEAPATATLPANGRLTYSLSIPLIDDTAYEGDETFRMAIDASRLPDWVTVGTHGAAVVTIRDDDTTGPAMWLSPSKVTVDEGLTGTYSVRLATEPTGTVTVGIASDNADVTVSPAQLTFNRTGTNLWSTPQAVTVSAAHDTGDAGADDAATLTHTATGGGYAGITGTVAVAVNDDDSTTVTLARAGAARVDEGTAARFALTATPAPAAPLSVTVEVTDSGQLAASGETGRRQVTVGTDGAGTFEVATDDDQTAEPHGTLTATLRPGAYTIGAEREASVRVSDDDITASLVHLGGTPLPEGAAGGLLTVLRKTLDGDQTLTLPLAVGGTATRGTDYRLVCVESVPAGAGTCNGIDGASPSVTFHGAHMTSRRVTGPLRIEAIEDGTAESDETLTLSLGGGRVLTTTLKDAPTSVTLTFVQGIFSVRENDGVFQPVLRVDAAPGRAIEVPLVFTDITATAGTDYETLATTTFPADGSTTYSLEIPLIDDAAHEGDETFRVAIDASRLPSWVAAGTHGAAVVTILDDEAPAPAIRLSQSAVTVDEGQRRNYSVHLATEPTGTVTVAIASDNADVTTNPAQLTFARTGTNLWSTPQRVAVSAAHDTGDGGADDTATLTHTATGGGYAGITGTVAVAVNDDDVTAVTPGVTVSTTTLALTEGGAAGSYTVVLDTAPSADVTVTATSDDAGAVKVHTAGGTPGASAMLTFTPTTWASAQTLTVTPQDDTDADDESVTIAHAVSPTGGYANVTAASVTVAVDDDDAPPQAPVVRIAAGAAVTEGGTATFTLSATPPPTSPLTVGVQVTQFGSFANDDQLGTKQVPVGTDGTGTLTVATVDDGTDEPDGSITVTVRAGTGYAPSATAHRATVLVADDDVPAGAPTLSVSDATAREGNRDRAMTFTVTLSRAAQGYVTFSWRVQESTPVSARRNVDFHGPTHATGHFRPGETVKRFRVYIADDAHDEGPETFEFFVWQVGGASVADAVGVGTIVNDDPMPAAFLARFGRTAAEQALDGIAGRMAAPRTPGARGTLAGQALGFGEGGGSGAVSDGDVIGGTGSLGGTGFGHGSLGISTGRSVNGDTGLDNTAPSRTLGLREALSGSRFTATGQTDATGGSLALWGRAAEARFDGREGAFSLDGETTTAMLGTDYARGDWLLGLALMQSEAEGEYRDTGGGTVRCPQALDAETRRTVCAGAVREGDGAVDASLTAAVPYAAVQASERLKLWGALGIGAGEVTLETAMGQRLDADIDWTMAAAGARSALLAAPREGSGPALALTTDALWARTGSEKTSELAASDSDVTRLRLGLEGSYRFATEGDGHLTPKLELGARHDGGDAETGFGVELGAGLAWSDPALGLSLDLSGRTLIAHGNDDLKDRGFAASLGFDPSPESVRGPSLTLHQTLGGQATGGLDALFRTDPLSDRTGGDTTGSRWQAEAAYGLPAFGGRFTASPHLGLSLGAGTRDYTLGWRLTPGTGTDAPELSLGVKAIRKESEGAASEHAVGVELGARW